MLIHRYYILYVNLANVKKQTQFRSRTQKEARLALLQESESYQDSSLSLIPACIHMRIFSPCMLFLFPLMDDGFFLTLADHSFPGATASGCLEAYHHCGRGKPHTFPSASWKQWRTNRETYPHPQAWGIGHCS